MAVAETSRSCTKSGVSSTPRIKRRKRLSALAHKSNWHLPSVRIAQTAINKVAIGTLNQTTLQGNVSFDAALKITVQIPQEVQQTTGGLALAAQAQTLPDTLGSSPAGLEYHQALTSNPNVQWDKVALANEHWSYEQAGLTPAGAALLSIAVAAYTGGMGAELLGVSNATAAAAVNAGFTSLASQTAVAMVNNGGDIGKTLEQLGKEESIKGLLTTMVTAGALDKLNASYFKGVDASSSFGSQLLRNVTNNLASSAIDAALNGKPFDEKSLSTALTNALITTGMATGANSIGDAVVGGDISNFTSKLAHAVLGCAGGMATGSTCNAGALGALVGEMAAEYINPNADPALKEKTLAFAKTMAAVAGVVAGGGGDNAAAVNAAATTGANAAENNWLGDHQKAAMNKEMAAATSNLDKLKVAGKYLLISGKQDILTTSGIGMGLADAGWSDVKALAQFMSDPVAGLQGIKQLISNPETRAAMGELVFSALNTKIDRINAAFATGGDDAAIQLGKDLGGLVWQVGTAVTGVAGTAKGATSLANAGINITAGALDAMAAAKAAKAAEAAQLVATQLNNFYRDGAPASLIQKTFEVAAKSSTQNAGASEVVLGRYIAGSSNSYDAVAQARGSTYFSMSDWNTVQGQLGGDQMWNINKAFLDQQMAQGKSFVFTADPAQALPKSYTALEFNHLQSNGYVITGQKNGLFILAKK